VYPPPFDATSPLYEQLPRVLTIDIFERNVGGKLYVFQTCNGINIGDRLTDNALTPDDYRFHDVFHYGYAAVLTWSPGISTWMFGQAKRLSDFEGIKPGELSFDILKQIRQFVAGYEPNRSPLWLWEEAILQGFEAFRFLKAHRRGRLQIDVHKRKLTIEELRLES
jgi:hypothetical protein